jgi:glycosyltransferase involved in cell wall biosynthesis
MNNIKIYLQYPWKFPDSPYYKYLIKDSPKGVIYLNIEDQKGVITHKKLFWFSNFLKRNIRWGFNLINQSIPNAHLTKTKEEFDLIHCAHCLSKNKVEPWVLDLESDWQIFIGKKVASLKTKEKIKKILERENCKKIMPWTEATKKELLKEFPEVKNKIEVVYPAVPEQNFKKKKKKEITLLFIARYFPDKGGFEAAKVMDYLTKKHSEVNGIILSDTPKKIIEKYSNNTKIKFMSLMPQKKVFEEIYPASNLLIYPGYSDSFGFAMLEAMSFGIPTITCQGYAREEIIEDGKTGFIAKGKTKEEEVKEMIRLTENLIKNKTKLQKMSKECLKTIKNGKFSIKERNKKLKRIYGRL